MEQRLIDANPLYDRLEVRYKNSSGAAHKAYDLAIDDVCDAPTVEAGPVVYGQWEKQRGIYSCSVCGKTCPYYINADVIEYWPCNFFPNCGAKMDLED